MKGKVNFFYELKPAVKTLLLSSMISAIMGGFQPNKESILIMEEVMNYGSFHPHWGEAVNAT